MKCHSVHGIRRCENPIGGDEGFDGFGGVVETVDRSTGGGSGDVDRSTGGGWGFSGGDKGGRESQ